MKKELIEALFAQFERARYDNKGVECWSARELQEILGYSEWTIFLKIIENAKNACQKSRITVSDHFADVGKMIGLGRNCETELHDIALSNYACCLIFQNDETQNDSWAFAQTYFAIQARELKIIEEILGNAFDSKMPENRTEAEKTMFGTDLKIKDEMYAIIRSKGDQVLFGGFTTQEMKKILMVPNNRPLADFLPTLTIIAKTLAIELTTHNVLTKNLKGEHNITKEHVDNNSAVRKMLLERGIKPETLPQAEDAKKEKRKIEKENKRVPNEGTRKEE